MLLDRDSKPSPEDPQYGHRINNLKITSSAQKPSEQRHRFKYVPHSLVSVDAAGAQIPVLFLNATLKLN